MESPNYIRAQLVNYTTANHSNESVKNNRYHYHLTFEQDIGWDWLYGQVRKCSAELDTTLEMWKIHPSETQSFEVEVREVGRRADIDDDQRGLMSFE